MQIGMMNDPAVDAVAEARWAAKHGFDFIDLTLEGPAADVTQVDLESLRSVIDESGLGVVGHTAWYLPFGSPVRQVRDGAIAAVVATFESLAHLGATIVSVHVDKGIGAFSYDDTLRWNAESFASLAEQARSYGLTVAIENVVNNLNHPKAIRAMLESHPDLRFHLDIAHANVKGEKTADFLKQHADKLVHVHVSDNKRVNDDHLPLGVGSIDWPEQIRLLKASGYDGTITLEIFVPDRSYLIENRARLQQLWEDVRSANTRE
jgi:sugar phosphate isomerase/epimerase